MVVGGDAIVNGAQRSFTGNTAETNYDLDEATESDREGKRDGTVLQLTTSTMAVTARLGTACGGRNRGRRVVGVVAVL